MWCSDSISAKNKAEKHAAEIKLTKLFEKKYSLEILERNFHSLHSAMKSEVKKRNQQTNTPKKKWKFYDAMLFITEEVEFSLNFEEKEVLIDFYRTPAIVETSNGIS